MIVTKNTFVSYSLARGTAQFQLILFILSLYTVIALPEEITGDNLKGLSPGKFRFLTRVMIPALVASLLLVNLLTDYLGFESIKYSASIMGLCNEFALFSLVLTCAQALNFENYTSFCYWYWLLILEVSIIGQIVSGVIFMMIRGCIRSKVQLRTIHETKCLPETDALTANKDEINLFSSFLIPFIVLIEVPLYQDFTNW